MCAQNSSINEPFGHSFWAISGRCVRNMAPEMNHSGTKSWIRINFPDGTPGKVSKIHKFSRNHEDTSYFGENQEKFTYPLWFGKKRIFLHENLPNSWILIPFGHSFWPISGRWVLKMDPEMNHSGTRFEQYQEGLCANWLHKWNIRALVLINMR